MSIQLVRKQTIAFTESGLSEVHDDLYIKLESDLAGWLRELKGARLSTFICIALQEARVCAEQGSPATLTDIAQATGYDERTVLYTVQWLKQHDFISEGQPIGQMKTYRPHAFAWFGGVKKVHRGEVFTPPKSVVVDGIDIPPGVEANQQQQQQAPAREILQAAGIVGKSLERLDAVSVENARIWADWIADPPLNVRNPQGIAVAVLSGDPEAEPPGRKPTAAQRKFHVQGAGIERFLAGKKGKNCG